MAKKKPEETQIDQTDTRSPFTEALEPAKTPEKKAPYTRHTSSAHDNITGVELNHYASTEHNIFEGRIYFRDGKPSDAVRGYMKENGFNWQGDAEAGINFQKEGAWVKPVAYNGAADREIMNRVYFNVNKMVRKEKGVQEETAAAR